MSVIAVVAIVAGGVALVALAVWLARRPARVADVTIVTPRESTELDPSGAVRSVQAADITMPADDLEAIWTPMHLERLARTYWRFLSRVTLGLIRVDYTPAERFVVFISRPAVLLRFRAPEYEMDARRGIVRWRIESGALVSRRGRGGDGYLQIDVRRGAPAADGRATLHVEVEVASFYPSIATGISRRVYQLTQSWIHVLITHGFLRSLARLDLAESKVGRFAATSAASASFEDVPDPPHDDDEVRQPAGTE
jgi:glycine/D-amino acid oxidase-like deaminating enzyme